MNVAYGHYMVKIVLIGKNRMCIVRTVADQGGSFGLEFILSETPRVMVNRALRIATLEHDPEKWEPVFGKDHAQTKN